MLSVINSCFYIKSHFPSMKSHWGNKPVFRADWMTSSTWPTWNTQLHLWRLLFLILLIQGNYFSFYLTNILCILYLLVWVFMGVLCMVTCVPLHLCAFLGLLYYFFVLFLVWLYLFAACGINFWICMHVYLLFLRCMFVF